MNRVLEAEWLDELPATDPQASGSRRDLRRLNWWMRHAHIAAEALRALRRVQAVPGLLELGGGDGDFLLAVARALGGDWSGTRAVLLDRQQQVVPPATLEAFHKLGWQVKTITCDVFDWCAQPDTEGSAVVLANLFLHHFDSGRLADLLQEIARRSSAFIALEPRRSTLPLLFSKLVWLIGCNAVTRHDAPASVRAGFRGTELTQLWPKDNAWTIRERPAGAFSQLFVAQQTSRAFREQTS